MKFVRSILLTFLCVLVFGSVTHAAEVPASFAYSEQSYVAVAGDAGAEYAGKNVTLMLVKTDADLNDISKSDIGYISQETVEEDGKYAFEFEFKGLTFDEEKNVNNYKIIVNVNGEKITSSVTKATAMSDMLVSFELDFSNFGRAVAEITNQYGLKDLNYRTKIGRAHV